MTALALLAATLIGVFVTPDGVVVGADTAVTARGGPRPARAKYCVTGPRTVATMQGVYELTDTETNATVALYDGFRAFCAEIDRTQLPATRRGQAEFIAGSLGLSLTAFLKGVPDAEIARRYAASPIVARVAVSGYDETGGGSVVVGLGVAVDPASRRWSVQVRDLPRLTFGGCGVRFHGQDVVVLALRTRTDLRVPAAERQTPEAQQLAALLAGACAGASIRSAPQLFAAAARLTIAHGRGFGIEPGIVDLPLDVIVIPAAGAIEVTRVVR